MPKTIPHRELRNNSSEILREVTSGETFQITNNGKVVALLTPVTGLAAPDVPIRKPTIAGGFDEIPIVMAEVTRPIHETMQETLDYLRRER